MRKSQVHSKKSIPPGHSSLNPAQRFAVAAIEFYRRKISPLKARPTCKYYPTCSQYAAEAVIEWGVIAGGFLSLCRLLRCNPFSRGGINHVPRKKRPTDSAALACRVRISYYSSPQ